MIIDAADRFGNHMINKREREYRISAMLNVHSDSVKVRSFSYRGEGIIEITFDLLQHGTGWRRYYVLQIPPDDPEVEFPLYQFDEKLAEDGIL